MTHISYFSVDEREVTAFARQTHRILAAVPEGNRLNAIKRLMADHPAWTGPTVRYHGTHKVPDHHRCRPRPFATFKAFRCTKRQRRELGL